MSHYDVNASVPKTLIQHLIRWVIDTRRVRAPTRARVLQSILDTEISPELVPRRSGDEPTRPTSAPRTRSAPTSCRTSTSTTSLASASGPSKVAFLAHHAWGDRSRGAWPDLIPDGRARNEYDLADDQELARRLPRTASSRSASSSARRSRTGPRSAPAARSPRAATGAPERPSAAAVWLEELDRNVPR